MPGHAGGKVLNRGFSLLVGFLAMEPRVCECEVWPVTAVTKCDVMARWQWMQGLVFHD